MKHARIPTATYRLQLNTELTLHDAAQIVDYLDTLGVSDVYASPILQARQGSAHGYDVIDPSRISPDIGGDEGLQALHEALAARGMGLIVDIVPNHMAADHENPWWRDLLEHGPAALHARAFDIDWAAGEGRLVLPLIDGTPEERLNDAQILLTAHGLALAIDGQRFPLDPATYPLALDAAGDIGLDDETLDRLRNLARKIPPRDAEGSNGHKARRQGGNEIKERLQRALDETPPAKERLEAGVRGDGDRIHTLHDRQAYRLADWRRGPHDTNYRRFFDINHLPGLRVEDPAVFDALHARVLSLVQDGTITGLRIDHVDGMSDPSTYLRHLTERLRELAPQTSGPVQERPHPPRDPPPCYLAVEKVLIANERLPLEWPVHGATGYEAGARLDGLCVDANGLEQVAEVYAWFLGRRKDFREEVHAAKLQVIRDLFPRAFAGLTRELHELLGSAVPDRPVEPHVLEEALIVTAASLPVYRTYVGENGVPRRDIGIIERTLQEAARRRPPLTHALDTIRDLLLLHLPHDPDPETAARRLHWIRRWQQTTGPVMAKGYEDTALYRYLGLVSLAEVGDDPETGTVWLESFHRFSTERLEDTPHALTATSTHDSKRSEDVRARLHVLSEIPRQWRRHLEAWRERNAAHKPGHDGAQIPGPDMEYLLYETLVGAWPLDKTELDAFPDRLAAYVVKAAREAKIHTDWMAPDLRYEEDLATFARDIAATPRGDPFREDVDRLLTTITYHGMLNSLAQSLLKCTMPGVPDIYQGQEMLELLLVDPDNRRRVDFARRREALRQIDEAAERDLDGLLTDIVRHWRDGRIKLYTTSRALRLRRELADVFAHGEYLPVKTHGRWGRHIVALARQRGGTWALAVVPRSTLALARGSAPLGRDVWASTRLRLPAGAPAAWRNVLTGHRLHATAEGARRGLDAAEVLERFPVALLTAGTSSIDQT